MFSIIIPTHDRPMLLQRTLSSLAAQTFRDFTTIIVSDSTQYIAPYESLTTLPGRYLYIIRDGSPGPAASRNIGIKLATSEYVLFLDDDDTLEPTHLESLAVAIRSRTKIIQQIYYCDFKIVEEDRTNYVPTFSKQTPIAIPGVSRESLFVKNVIPNSCLVYPQAIVQSAFFDSSLILFEDWDYLLACLQNADLVHLPINSVSIHKSYIAGAHNIRRGNVNNEHLIHTTLALYRRYRSPNDAVKQQRAQLFEALGLVLPPDCL